MKDCFYITSGCRLISLGCAGDTLNATTGDRERAARFQATPGGLSLKAAIACFSLGLGQSCYHDVKQDVLFVVVDNFFLSIKNQITLPEITGRPFIK